MTDDRYADNSENPLGPEMEADYQRRKARFYASFEKKRQQAEATFERYRDYYEQRMAPPVIVIHLVMDEDRDRTACTGELWRPPPDDYYPKVPRQLCEACRRAGTR